MKTLKTIILVLVLFGSLGAVSKAHAVNCYLVYEIAYNTMQSRLQGFTFYQMQASYRVQGISEASAVISHTYSAFIPYGVNWHIISTHNAQRVQRMCWNRTIYVGQP